MMIEDRKKCSNYMRIGKKYSGPNVADTGECCIDVYRVRTNVFVVLSNLSK